MFWYKISKSVCWTLDFARRWKEWLNPNTPGVSQDEWFYSVPRKEVNYLLDQRLSSWATRFLHYLLALTQFR